MEPKYRNGSVFMVAKPVTITKFHPDAEDFSKENLNDPFWELTIVTRRDNRVDDVFGDVNEFGTWLAVKAPEHYHLEIIEHPQLYKSGYSLVGGPRIIAPSQSGSEIVIPLMKFREGEDISLPYRAAILVMRETQYGTTTVLVPKRQVESRYVEESMFMAAARPVAATATTKRGGKKGNHMGWSREEKFLFQNYYDKS